MKEFLNRSKLDWVIYRFQKAVQAKNYQNIECWCGALPQIDMLNMLLNMFSNLNPSISSVAQLPQMSSNLCAQISTNSNNTKSQF